MQKIMDYLETLRRAGQRLGPYLMLEILLPGGSLFALMLFLYQRRKIGFGSALPRSVTTVMRALASLVPQPCYARTSRVLPAAIENRE